MPTQITSTASPLSETRGSPADELAAWSRRAQVVALGLTALLVVLALVFELNLFGDGALFSYAVAVGESWRYHWHNIPVRATVWLYAHLPAETWVALTGDARGAVTLYTALFYLAPALGLLLTWRVDRTPGRVVLTAASISTLCLLPLVAGFPTEMWHAHSLFWPVLAMAHGLPRSAAATAALVLAMTALMLTHEGALIFALFIVASLAIHGIVAPQLGRGALAIAVGLAVWISLRLVYPPDAYFLTALPRAAAHFIDLRALSEGVMPVLAAAAAGYGLAFALVWWRWPGAAPLAAAGLTLAGLALYWLTVDTGLHSVERYAVRTALLIATPCLGAAACLVAYGANSPLRPIRSLAWALRLPDTARRTALARAMAGLVVVTVAVHTVEMGKFLAAWTTYKADIRALAMGSASDPDLGHAEFVSVRRLDRAQIRPLWLSTTHFLSVLLAPGYRPQRLVVDPYAGYIWLSCATALATQNGERAIPRASRALISSHDCQARR